MKLTEQIMELKKEKNAVILAHNYQIPEIQDIADVVGDSYVLAKKAMDMDARIIVLCGVRFMAEVASILNPDKKVLIPVRDALCPMAGMVEMDRLRMAKEHYSILAYVNTTAETKAMADVCCTSANAVEIAKKMGDNVLFVPDRNLGEYIKRRGNPHVHVWDGYCYVHENIQWESIEKIKKRIPEAKVMAHPECRCEILQKADFVGSTEAMVRFAGTSPAKAFIVATEEGLVYRLSKCYPEKQFYPIENAVCKDMKKISLKEVYLSLRDERYVVKVDEQIAVKAKHALEKMLEMVEG